MDLQALQTIIARLYTEPAFREAFCNDPLRFAKDQGLDDSEALWLSLFPQEELRVFGSSLQNKRWGQIRGFLPATAVLFQECLRPLFLTFSKGFVPKGIKKHAHDALAFASFLLSLPPSEPAFPPDLPSFWKDLLRYEAQRIKGGFAKTRFCFQRYAFPVHHLREALVSGRSTEAWLQKKNKTWIVSFRWKKRGALGIWIWPRG